MDKNTYNEVDVLVLIKDLIAKLKKHKKKIYFTFCLPVFVSFAFYFLWPKQYELVLVGSSKYIRPEALTEIGRALDIAAKDRNGNLLGSILKIEPNLAKRISKIKVNSIRPDVLVQSTTPQKETYFQLIITVSSIKEKDLLQKAFMSYLEDNPYVVERKKLNQQMDRKMIEKILTEIANLEEFRKQLMGGKYSDAKFIMMDPSKINQTMVDLNYQVSQLQINLELKSEFSVIQGFISPEKPSFPRFGISLLVGVTIGLLFAFGIALISD